MTLIFLVFLEGICWWCWCGTLYTCPPMPMRVNQCCSRICRYSCHSCWPQSRGKATLFTFFKTNQRFLCALSMGVWQMTKALLFFKLLYRTLHSHPVTFVFICAISTEMVPQTAKHQNSVAPLMLLLSLLLLSSFVWICIYLSKQICCYGAQFMNDTNPQTFSTMIKNEIGSKLDYPSLWLEQLLSILLSLFLSFGSFHLEQSTDTKSL